MSDEKKTRVLMQPNEFVNANYNISVIENRVFMLVLYKLQKANDTTLTCEITFNEFNEVIKRKNDRTIKAIGNMLEELRKSTIEFKVGNRWGKYGFINGFHYDEEKNLFIIEASKIIYDVLFSYLKGYTPKNLEFFFRLRNFNSQRMYDLLRLWSNSKKVINYSVDDIKRFLQLENQYNLYGDFKKRIIEPSIKELNKSGMFEITYKENKVGRKVVSLDFIVKDLDKRKYFEKPKKSIDSDENTPIQGQINIDEVEAPEKVEISEKELLELNKTYSRQEIEYALKELKSKKDIKNPLSYFEKTLENQRNQNLLKSQKTLNFTNYNQREYDYDLLEKQLLGWDE